MVHVLVRHKVNDVSHWMSVFESAHDMRRAAGELSARMFRSPLDPVELNLLCEWDDLEKAKAFFGQPALQAAMRQAGVVGTPEIEFLEEIHIVHRTAAD